LIVQNIYFGFRFVHSELVVAFGGTTNGTRPYCSLPFTYQGKAQSTCLRTDPPSSSGSSTVIQPWCSLTSDFDRDNQWGFCDLGITDSTTNYICRSRQQYLRCPSGYVIDIITARYAAKPDGNIGADACKYDQNDCFQNDASTIQSACAGKTSCVANHYAKNLVSCQNLPTAYLHIEYTCIPNDLQDITTYNLCNSTFVPQGDTRRGYLISPEFPRTPNNIDCTFDLHTVRPNQDIYLYILDMDLNSPSGFGQACSQDRLIVRTDESQRELCERSNTDFLINTCHASIYLQLIRGPNAKGRGVKFYFEFRERSPQEFCPQVISTSTRTTLTPLSSTMSTAVSRPAYFPNPSPRMITTLCYLDTSGMFGANNFKCPADYVLVVHRAFYGRGARCDYMPGDCTTEANNFYQACSGKQQCSFPFLNLVTLSQCKNAIANYLFVEYQCLPTLNIAQNVQDLCTFEPSKLGDISGVLKSPSYPTYASTKCNNVTLSSFDGSNLVMYIYLLDMNIGLPDVANGNCFTDYLKLSYQCDNEWFTQTICGTRTTELLFDTCSPKDKVVASFDLNTQDSQSQRGFALFYHFLPMTIRNITSSTPARISTTSTVTLPPGPGPLSTPIEPDTTCIRQTKKMQCDKPGYVLILYKVYLVSSATGTCTYSSDDCFEDRTNNYNFCAGKTTCSIFSPSTPIKTCNGSASHYLYTEHQCIPSAPKLNVDICSSKAPFERVEGGAIISSLNYTSNYQQCQLQVQSNPLLGSQTHRAFRIYILEFNFPVQPNLRGQGAQCKENDPTVEIEDPEQGITRLCGSSHPRYLLETCSSAINVRFQNLLVNPIQGKFTGFKLYFESIENSQCRVNPINTTPPPTSPFVIQRQVACSLAGDRERVNFGCTSDHGLVFLQSYAFATAQPLKCDVSSNLCHYPSTQPAAQCSSQQTCSYVYKQPAFVQSNVCKGVRADSIEFYYQCLPMRPSPVYSKVTFCSDQVVTMTSGFIETAKYPSSYQMERRQCTLRIALPTNNDVTRYSVYLYVIDVALRDTSIVNPSASVDCVDSLSLSDGITSKSLCGVIDQPSLVFRTDRQALTLSLNLSGSTSPAEFNYWRGARLFFIIADQTLPVPPAPILSPTTTTYPSTITRTTISSTSTARMTTSSDGITERTKPKSGISPGAVIAIIIGVLVVLFAIAAGIYYRRHLQASGTSATAVRYQTENDGLDGINAKNTNKQQNSIPTASLKGSTTSTFTSPFVRKMDTDENAVNNA
jgi:hypothetical protein